MSLRHQSINQEVRGWSDGSQRLMECRSQPHDMNAGLPQYPYLAASIDWHQIILNPTCTLYQRTRPTKDVASLIKPHDLCFVYTEAYVTCCPFQTMQQGLCQGWCIYQKHYVISVVRVRNSLSGVSSASCLCQRKVIRST